MLEAGKSESEIVSTGPEDPLLAFLEGTIKSGKERIQRIIKKECRAGATLKDSRQKLYEGVRYPVMIKYSTGMHVYRKK